MNKLEITRKKSGWFRYGLLAVVAAMAIAPVAAYAADAFDDVPDTNIFHADIAWMADNGITAGCGGNNFCPKQTVTREQMSAFMKRLAVNKVVDAATALEADHAATADSATTAANATTADSAADATTVSGRSIGCAAGQTEFAGECWETAARSTVPDVYDAADACGDDGGRLPGALELRRFGQISSVTSPSAEWTSNIYYDGGYRALQLTGTGVSDEFTITPGTYRCVFSLIETAATPASVAPAAVVGEDGS